LILLDEVTTGLDATTSLAVLARVNLAAKVLNIPVICSLQQPSFELFNQFDKLLLMEKGRVAYFGPIEGALPFFETLHFRCPPHENPADFLPTVLHDPSLYFEAGADSPNAPPRTVRQIVQAYRRSEYFSNVEHEINQLVSDLYDPDASTRDSDSDSSASAKLIRHPLKGARRRGALRESHTLTGHKYPLSLARQTYLLVKRGFLQHKNDTSTIVTRFVSAIIMSVILGTFFFQLGDSLVDTQNKGGLTL
jgi:ATP-binding cassette, subfamily G (WHITE), member 2, PDR